MANVDTGIDPRPSPESDFNIGTLGVTRSGHERYRVSARTGWPGVSILSEGETTSLICSFCLSAAAC